MAWSRLQSKANGAINASSVSATFTSNVSAGTKLIAWVIGDNNTSFSVSSVKDGAGNTFTSIASTGFSNSVLGSCYAIDTPAGDVGTTPTITVTVSATVADVSVLIQEISGLAPGDAHDGTPGTSTAVAAASVAQPAYTSSAANEYLATFFGDDGQGQTATVPSGYTADASNVTSSSADAICVGFKNSTGGAESGTWTFTGPIGNDGFIVVAFKLAVSSGQEALAPVVSPGLFQSPAMIPGVIPQPADPSWLGAAPFPPGAEAIPAVTPLTPPFSSPSSWSQPWIPPGDPGIAAVAVVLTVPQFIDQSGYRPRSSPRVTRGSFQVPGLGQGNQGVQFPLFTRQPSQRVTLRRSQGRYFSPGQFNEVAPQLPFFQGRTLQRLTLRRSHGIFSSQEWGQGNQGIAFPLYTRQAQLNKRLTLRRSGGQFFNPGQFSLSANPSLPVITRQVISRRIAARVARGQFFMQAWGQAATPPGITSGAEQYPQIVPPFSSPGFFWQPWVPPADPGFFPVAAVIPVPQFPRQTSQRNISIRHGKLFGPGQFNEVAPSLPNFTRNPGRTVPERVSRGKYFSPGKFNLIGNSYPAFTRAGSRPVPARISRGHYFSPGQFNLTANPSLPQFLKQNKRNLIRESHGQYFNPGQFNLSANPGLPAWVSPRRPKPVPPRRGNFSGIPKTAIIPVWLPEFRITRRPSFTRIRHGNVIQLTQTQGVIVLPEMAIKLGIPMFRWITGGLEKQWRVP